MIRILEIDDAEGFVKAAIKKAGIPYQHWQYEDLVATGYLLLVELSHKYDPAREDDGISRFHGYAHYLLPMKLRDAWHSMNPEHLFRTQSDGKRRWEYAMLPYSYDQIIEDQQDGDRHHWGRFEITMRLPGDFVRVPVATATART